MIISSTERPKRLPTLSLPYHSTPPELYCARTLNPTSRSTPMNSRRFFSVLLSALLLSFCAAFSANAQTEADVKAHYTKMEQMIPMRDGVRSEEHTSELQSPY